MTGTETFDADVRVAIASLIRRAGRVPTIAETAAELRADPAAVSASFDRLAAARVFIARRVSSEILAFNPFCADRTEFRVRSDGREWWAICGWDALGIPAALGAAGSIETGCPDCGELIVIDVDRDGAPSASTDVVLEVGVRPADFWKDIYFT